MLEIIVSPVGAVHLHLGDIRMEFLIVSCCIFGIYCQAASVFQLYDCLSEERSTDYVFIRSRTYRIESQCREYIPC